MGGKARTDEAGAGAGGARGVNTCKELLFSLLDLPACALMACSTCVCMYSRAWPVWSCQRLLRLFPRSFFCQGYLEPLTTELGSIRCSLELPGIHLMCVVGCCKTKGLLACGEGAGGGGRGACAPPQHFPPKQPNKTGGPVTLKRRLLQGVCPRCSCGAQNVDAANG